MIGFYDYTVVLTYISFISAVAGIFCASSMQLRWSIFFLAFSGLCDMFDGKVARTKKNRTEDEKSFGIQIDSLCDIVCFGALPIVICYKLGMNHIVSMVILALYGLAGLIRLGYFNVMEAKRQAEEEGRGSIIRGCPLRPWLSRCRFCSCSRRCSPPISRSWWRCTSWWLWWAFCSSLTSSCGSLP